MNSSRHTVVPSTAAKTGAFSFKKLSDFMPFFHDPVRLGNRTYRAWSKNQAKE